jgi:hypothetical protein
MAARDARDKREKAEEDAKNRRIAQRRNEAQLGRERDRVRRKWWFE